MPTPVDLPVWLGETSQGPTHSYRQLMATERGRTSLLQEQAPDRLANIKQSVLNTYTCQQHQMD